MSDKAKSIIIQIVIVAIWIMFFVIIIKNSKAKNSGRKPEIGQKEVYEFQGFPYVY